MSLKSFGAKIFARRVVKSMNVWASKPVETQKKVLSDLISKAKDTQFGKDHGFSEITSAKDFAERVPIRDYEALRNYVDRMVAG